MSYSFSITADTKAEAKQKISDGFAQVVAQQPIHAADQQAAVACAHAFVDTLADPHEGDEVCVSMSGWLSWRDSEAGEFLSAGVSTNASLRNKSKSG